MPIKMKNLVREPLLQFFVLAAILFAFDYFWSATKKERIVVDRQSAEYLIEQLRDDYEIVIEGIEGLAQ